MQIVISSNLIYGFKSLRLLLVLPLCMAAIKPTLGHNPVDYLEVFDVAAGVPIEHDVELECEDILARKSLSLRGPVRFSGSIGCMKKAGPKDRAFICWYKVERDPQPAEQRKIKTLDFLRNGKNLELKIESEPSFLLSPAQYLSAGEPAPVPEGLDHYLAFKVTEEASIGKSVQLTGRLNGEKTSQRQVGKAAYICLPTSEWHHDEHFEVSHRLTCFVAYELDRSVKDGTNQKLSTLDQFGLNQLTVQGPSRMLLARGAILK